MPSPDIELECEFVRETDAAVLITVNTEEYWIPLSQVTSMHKAGKGTGSIVMSRWIANQKGLI